MSEQAGPVCPECGTARAADGTPACGCARRASDAHRAVRTAEAAAAEDFDPVRIRPFVEVGGEGPPASKGAESDPAGELTGVAGELTSPATTIEPDRAPDRAPDVEPADPARRRRRRRTLMAAGLGATGVVVLTGCLVGGLFWYDSPERDDSLSGGVRAGLPDEQPSATAPLSPSASPSATSTQPSASATVSAGASDSVDPATPTGSTAPTRTASGAAPTATGGAATPSSSGGQAPVLRPGDKGPEVTELQLRLSQVGFYSGDADGTYNSQVESAVRGYQFTRVVVDDEPGVYGPETRADLESETSEP
ncbi:putative peptidoglycan binding protein [Streptomyces sp. TLI_55]|uniref:peptidoglycan-binding domain-containing protein n=1 Tax=Streptomyces sp. TLI_55 TaxID=1938861 RepID=UPI000BC8C580|nr:peptidoglycan-binding domain-containing protein [Streptomyces sp. TLI_55]SNX65879.1 putative peptidoglycan binding protein [Streptomyces sp. TLI_55]